MRRGDVLTGPAVADLTGPPDFGPYRVGELVGQGGMGTVHRAYDTVNRRVVALKRLPGTGVDAEFVARFRREARVAAGLRHPHVVPVHAFGEIDGQLYLDMALIDGTDLRRLLGGEAVDPPRVLAVLDQIAAALDAAHAAGLVHRDVKPSNILIGPDDHAYLADFGIARSMSSESTDLTRSGALLGTLDYLAPERLSSAPVDGRADQYSLACVLFECLTGRLPHPTVEPAAKLAGHLLRPPTAPSVFDPTLAPAVDAGAAAGHGQGARRRFPSCAALLEAAGSALTAHDGGAARRDHRDRPGAGLPDPRDRPGHGEPSPAGTATRRWRARTPGCAASRRPTPRGSTAATRWSPTCWSASPSSSTAVSRSCWSGPPAPASRRCCGPGSVPALAAGQPPGSGVAAGGVHAGRGSGRRAGGGARPGGRRQRAGAGGGDPQLAHGVRPLVPRARARLGDRGRPVRGAVHPRGVRRGPARPFATALAHAGPALVLLAVRADLVEPCIGLAPLRPALAAPVLLGPLNRDELRQAVLAPARDAGLRVEPGLAERLLADFGAFGDAGHDPGALPRLAHALRETWRHGDGTALTLAAYRRAGGIDGAVARTAEQFYAGLDEAGRRAAHGVLLRLVVVLDDGVVARRRADAPS